MHGNFMNFDKKELLLVSNIVCYDSYLYDGFYPSLHLWGKTIFNEICIHLKSVFLRSFRFTVQQLLS